ncbi:MAG: T9SS type A sorting domain-containing protein [Bacteroidetes bacterium]|nr:T9SS type A sorting domain-containing protein [Bacteroidota bacterium]
MKKIYVCLVGLLAAGTVMAQKNSPVVNGKKNPFIGEKAPKGVFAQPKGITLWQNDFSVQTDWATGNAGSTGTPPHSAGDWTITTNASAAPVAALNPAAFTSVANGYAIIDSDAEGQSATQNAWIYYTGTIDLSATGPNGDQPFVVINFQQTHRRYAESTYVIYSLDGGATWQEVEVNATQTQNTNTSNPSTVQVNMSNQIGGQANVKIGFKYTGNYDWFWAVDDVKLMTPDDYDLEMTGAHWGSTGSWDVRLPYYQIPLAQLTTIDIGGIVSNLGALDQTDVVFTASLTAGGAIGTSAPSTVVAGSADTLDITTPLTPPATVANHVVNLAASSGATDAAPTNNAITNAATISVNNYIYARDKGTLASGSYNQGQGFEVGNIFDIYAAATLKGIDVVIHPQAVAGAEMYVKLYSINPTGDFVFVDESTPYALTTANLGQKITLALSGPVQLNANESYLIVAGSNGDGGATDDLIVGTAGVSEALTSFYYDMTNTTWYYTTSTPMVRMNFDPIVSVNEVENTFGLSVYPNPANEVINISLNKSTNATISVVDVAGKVVKTSSINGLTSSINASDLTNGVYYVTITDGTSVATEKVVIKK